MMKYEKQVTLTFSIGCGFDKDGGALPTNTVERTLADVTVDAAFYFRGGTVSVSKGCWMQGTVLVTEPVVVLTTTVPLKVAQEHATKLARRWAETNNQESVALTVNPARIFFPSPSDNEALWGGPPEPSFDLTDDTYPGSDDFTGSPDGSPKGQ